MPFIFHLLNIAQASLTHLQMKNAPLLQGIGLGFGGERGIRTLDTLLEYTHFPGVLLKPLGQLSLVTAAGAAKGKIITDPGMRQGP